MLLELDPEAVASFSGSNWQHMSQHSLFAVLGSAAAAGTFRPTAGGCKGGLSQTVFDPAAAGPAPEGF